MAVSIALLSNVNVNTIIRSLDSDMEVYRPEGYGNELGLFMNPESSYREFHPQITFFVMDLMELLHHEPEPEAAYSAVRGWFAGLEGALEQTAVYFISDAYLWGDELDVLADAGRRAALEHIWQEELLGLMSRHGNVRIFPYRRLVETLGEEAFFSRKTWYLGKIPWTGEATRRLAEAVRQQVEIETRVPAKVLVLDLDNTLWGGLAGEHEHTPIRLSEEHAGLAYKNLQRVILQMQRQGVLLAIVSKNNETDVIELMNTHPHMVLQTEHFAARRINWEPKDASIREIAEELNLGLDSFVFWDDNPAERELIRKRLPQVAVPDFPENPEELAPAMVRIHRDYFARPVLTEEDLAKTRQYADNARRKELEAGAGSYEEYLESLSMEIVREDPQAHVERLTQLLNKTNQFNLTTRRHDQAEVERILSSPEKEVFLYRVVDRFGDSGIVAAILLDIAGSVPVIAEFVMSCRVMGRTLEQTFLWDVEERARRLGYGQLEALYIPTAKNAPVESLYERLGYERVGNDEAGSVFADAQDCRVYRLDLKSAPERARYAGFRDPA